MRIENGITNYRHFGEILIKKLLSEFQGIKHIVPNGEKIDNMTYKLRKIMRTEVKTQEIFS